MLARAQQHERPASLPGSTPAASAGSSPARSAEDLPLPDGPTMPISGAPASRATISATRRSRPKKNSASSTSNDASPLNGQATSSDVDVAQLRALAQRLQPHHGAGESVFGRAQSVRSVAARLAEALIRRAASARAHSAASRCTRCGIPPLSRTSRSAAAAASSRSSA